MTKLPIHIARKLQDLLLAGHNRLPASGMKHEVVTQMLEEGVLERRLSGKTRALLFVPDGDALRRYLYNHFGIADLGAYIRLLQSEDISRSEAIVVSGNSKLTRVRTFKGFLVNGYRPIPARLNDLPFIIEPPEGSYSFIYNYEHFWVPPSVTIVGVENSENFRQIRRQQYLFDDQELLFISRYPQSNDLLHWLNNIPNSYLHFGDFDFEGINIYLHEYKKHLGERARFFIPANIDFLIEQYGNRALFNSQYEHRPPSPSLLLEPGLAYLLDLFYKKGKVLEQEILILQDL